MNPNATVELATPGHGCESAGLRQRIAVIGVPIDALSPPAAVERISQWAALGASRVVCICNVHSVVTANQDPAFNAAISEADMATPDGAPVAWMMRRLGAPQQCRVSGPDLMHDYCTAAAQRGEAIYLYGSTPETLATLTHLLPTQFPGLRIAGSWSPPFRAPTADEDAADVERINRSGAGTVWVSLGCPKQERWMTDHRGHVNAVMVGVGAAFDFHAGTVVRAPAWMRRHGLEWLHRLVSEPRRLARRYIVTNTAFILRAAGQLVRRN